MNGDVVNERARRCLDVKLSSEGCIVLMRRQFHAGDEAGEFGLHLGGGKLMPMTVAGEHPFKRIVEQPFDGAGLLFPIVPAVIPVSPQPRDVRIPFQMLSSKEKSLVQKQALSARIAGDGPQ